MRPGRADALPLVALGPYRGALKSAILALKFRGARSVGARLGRMLSLTCMPCDAIVPVPLHAQRLRARGYNQAALIADGIAAAQGGSRIDALVRIRATAMQSSLDATARATNVRGAFGPSSEAHRISGRAVLLVDDVATTGATSLACAAALREAGALDVHLAVAAVVL
jgi:ComF family protein